MTHSSATPGVTVTVGRAAEVADRLTAAVDAVLAETAGNSTKGILVTAHGPDTFTVELSDEVPYGTTLERYNY